MVTRTEENIDMYREKECPYAVRARDSSTYPVAAPPPLFFRGPPRPRPLPLVDVPPSLRFLPRFDVVVTGVLASSSLPTPGVPCPVAEPELPKK